MILRVLAAPQSDTIVADYAVWSCSDCGSRWCPMGEWEFGAWCSFTGEGLFILAEWPWLPADLPF